ncbi:MAG: ThuA domain-containing protein [Acidobacteriota bacterium]
MRVLFLTLMFSAVILPRQAGPTSLTFAGTRGPGAGKHIVLLSGDEEYRSEESMPMLARLLSERHGFTTTVLFPLDADGTINPNNGASLSDPAALDRADLIVMALRFRHWSDDTMARFERKVMAGTPIVAIRTSTHAFNGFPAASPWARWNYNNNGGFGREVLGETWVNHWGRHKIEATRGAIEPSARAHPVLRGISTIFGDTDVYEAYPAADAQILVRGLVLQTLAPDAPLASYQKARASDKQMQDINTPPMPIVWTRLHRNANGRVNRTLTSTIGSATDFADEGVRRLIVNGVFWGLGLDVPAKADVRIVDPYSPSSYGFDAFRKGLRPADVGLGRAAVGAPSAR